MRKTKGEQDHYIQYIVYVLNIPHSHSSAPCRYKITWRYWPPMTNFSASISLFEFLLWDMLNTTFFLSFLWLVGWERSGWPRFTLFWYCTVSWTFHFWKCCTLPEKLQGAAIFPRAPCSLFPSAFSVKQAAVVGKNTTSVYEHTQVRGLMIDMCSLQYCKYSLF